MALVDEEWDAYWNPRESRVDQEIVQLLIITVENNLEAFLCLIYAQDWVSQDLKESLLFIVSSLSQRIDEDE